MASLDNNRGLTPEQLLQYLADEFQNYFYVQTGKVLEFTYGNLFECITVDVIPYGEQLVTILVKPDYITISNNHDLLYTHIQNFIETKLALNG